MVWPFGSRVPTEDAENENLPTKRAVSWSEMLRRAEADPLGAAKEWAPVVLFSLVGLGALQLYANYLRRIPGAAFVRPSFFRSRSLFGRVTSVGDGDNFHLFHTPGGKAVGWGWLRKIPEVRKELKDRTIPIRLAGVDAPEGAHFGRPAQPFAAEALTWLSQYILHRNVRAYIYKRDQYNRIVATVYVRRFLIRRNVGLEMVKRGLATTYEAKSGGEYGGLKSVYEKAEAIAKRNRKGMWSGKPSEFESPRKYKSRYQGSEEHQ
ncbi:putative endonuclease lcl3 [Epichloe festucae Fl1]|uniref:Probable endonuclease LCL3 n=1 Tax=Epichloe festucae (strain Fl1) TaxID=877507 RepID=A0A7S9PVK7_EPIFF|nr:putative endonuclease lcl3 [Epichloe festucae Fl1]